MSDSLIKRGPRTEAGRIRCGNWKHGLRSAQARKEQAALRMFLRDCRKTIAKAVEAVEPSGDS